MELIGDRLLEVPRDRVWAALNDPDILKQCVPGCEEMSAEAADVLVAQILAKVGPIKARFSGRVQLTDIVEATTYTLVGEGQGGVAGFAKGRARVDLEDEAAATRLRYDVRVDVGGKLAQIGSRLLGSTARKLTEEFFDRFATLLSTSEHDAA